MLGLRRAFVLGLRQAWRAPPPPPPPPLSGPPCGGGGWCLPLRRSASGLEAPSPWVAAPAAAAAATAATGAASPEEGEEEEEEKFVFPEFVPPEGEDEAAAAALGLQPQPPLLLPAAEPGLLPEAEEPPRRGRREPPKKRKGQHRVTGQPDPSVPASGVSCSGCGAELHCQDAALPGYLPSGKYLQLVAPEREEGEEEEGGGEGERSPPPPEPPRQRPPLQLEALQEALCQRCWLLRHHQMALRVRMSPQEYRQVVSAALRRPPARPGQPPPLVLCVVDLLDLPDSILPDLPELVGGSQALRFFVLGNKVDLLPGDAPRYLRRLRERLMQACAQAGLPVVGDGEGEEEEGGSPGGGGGGRVVDVHLVSARTGFGVEGLITKLQSSWKLNGDVYLVGSTNSGKSTLFNLLLHSDFCNSKASDVIKRATVSPWPGTTLNLLKFPIISPRPYRIFQRKSRLQADANKTEDDLSEYEKKNLSSLKKQGYLVGLVGRTFKKPQDSEDLEIEFDAEALSFSTDEEPSFVRKAPAKEVELTYNEVKDSRWFYDTPGIVRDGCILNLLNEKEIKLALPTCAIVPRTFVLKPGMTLFLGSLGRIDYLQGDQPSWFSVIASNLLPVHITAVEKADAIYQKHAGQALLKVPIGGEERMKDFPPFESHDVDLEGIGDTEAVADIKFSSAGWVAVTAHLKHKICLRCYIPEGTKLTVRQPPLLPYIVQVKGKRKKKSPAYETVKPPSLVENLKTSRKSRKVLSGAKSCK